MSVLCPIPPPMPHRGYICCVQKHSTVRYIVSTEANKCFCFFTHVCVYAITADKFPLAIISHPVHPPFCSMLSLPHPSMPNNRFWLHTSCSKFHAQKFCFQIVWLPHRKTGTVSIQPLPSPSFPAAPLHLTPFLLAGLGIETTLSIRRRIDPITPKLP